MTLQQPLVFTHDPDASLDYTFNWDPWLDPSDSIDAFTVTANDDTVSVDQTLNTPRYVVAWVSGGTLGTVVDLTCHIVTTAGRRDDRTIVLRIRER
jgi:hypothetical protein